MATLPPVQTGNPLLSLDESDCLPPHVSAFQLLLEFACRRVGELRDTDPETDRRSVPRKKTALRAVCSGAWGDSMCLISDFGAGGLAFVCGHPHRIGEHVRVSWQDQQGPRLEIECTVRHVTGANIGVEFQNVNAQERWRLVASLARLADCTGDRRFATAA